MCEREREIERVRACVRVCECVCVREREPLHRILNHVMYTNYNAAIKCSNRVQQKNKMIGTGMKVLPSTFPVGEGIILMKGNRTSMIVRTESYREDRPYVY